jgi:hypothetical protein
MKFLLYLCLLSCILTGCGSFVTREELVQSQQDLQTQLQNESLAVHTCAQTLRAITTFNQLCQMGSTGHCAAVESWVQSCNGADAQDNLVLPEPGVWDRVMTAGLAAEAAERARAAATVQELVLDSEEAEPAPEESTETTTP